MNKYERNIDQKFDLGIFNKVFEEKRNKNDYSIVNDDDDDDDIIELIPIHKRTIEYIIIRTRELFYTLRM